MSRDIWDAKVGRGVVIPTTLDTKSDEMRLLVDALQRQGVASIIVDCGVLGTGTLEADIPAESVAELGGSRLDVMRQERNREAALAAMTLGLRAVIRRLSDLGQATGLICFGGGTNAALASAAIEELPFGIPKLVVSTVVSGNTSRLVGSKDVVLVHSVVDVLGTGAYVRALAERTARLMRALLDEPPQNHTISRDKKVAGLTSFGSTTAAANHAFNRLSKAGLEVLAFHARGTGGVAMETFIRDRKIDAVLDLTTTEIADEVVGGISSAGPTRLDAAALRGIPQVLLPGAIDMVNFGPWETVPERFRQRTFLRHTPTVTLMRTSAEESVAIAMFIARKLENARGPVTIVVPQRGFSAYDAVGAPFYDPTADHAFASALKAALPANVQLIELDAHINDPKAIDLAVDALLALIH